MTDLIRLEALIEKVGNANSGSHDLDADIYEAFGYEVIRQPRRAGGIHWRFRGLGGLSEGWHSHWQVQEHFTQSLDAAKGLWWRLPLPEMIPAEPKLACYFALSDRARFLKGERHGE